MRCQKRAGQKRDLAIWLFFFGLSFLGFPCHIPEARPASHITALNSKRGSPVGYNPYNGYSGKERDEKEAERARLLKSGELQMRHSACELCGDPDTPTKPHVEDYSKPYMWEPPAEYMVCDTCENDMLQKRFRNKDRWDSFKAHV